MESKQRHGCVTAWLIFMIIANSLTAIFYLFMGDAISQNLANPIPQPMMLGLAVLGIANLIFSIMLFQWKKWAFWGISATSLIALAINLSIGLGIGTSMFGLIGIVILYGILQIKKDGITTWENLE
jgi:predicted membrane metal-binding protein